MEIVGVLTGSIMGCLIFRWIAERVWPGQEKNWPTHLALMIVGSGLGGVAGMAVASLK